MTIDTEKTIYVCTDRENANVHLLLPRALLAYLKEHEYEIAELKLSDPDPESTDFAEYRLICEDMEEFTFDV